jgi:hypothetical protein
LQRRCDRNRKRSKKRAIYCPTHGCHLSSVSPKHSLFVKSAKELQQRGISRQSSQLLIANNATVLLEDEWLEAFWCEECQETKWYHVKKCTQKPSSDKVIYKASLAPPEQWQQAIGVINPEGNPSVSEFTRRQSKRVPYREQLNYEW